MSVQTTTTNGKASKLRALNDKASNLSKALSKTKDRADLKNEEISKLLKDGAKPVTLTIPPPNIRVVRCTIVGTAPYVQNKFAAKAAIMATQQAGSTAKSKKTRAPKDFLALFKAAQHIAADGWNGMPASGFRNAMIDACRLVGYQMTKAKMSIFIVEDGFDTEGTPLVKIIGDAPEKIESHVRNDSGVIDIRARPQWKKWSAKLNVKYDADQFTESDIVNLLNRAGQQVGVGEGRPFSKDSAGMGWGTFEVQ